MSHQQVTCLTLLDLSAAFDTIFSSSWTYFILVWHLFYDSLSDQILFLKRSFYVNIENSNLSVSQILYEFFIFGLPQQLSKLNNPTTHLPNNIILSNTDSARNLGVIFDKNMSFAQHISIASKSGFHNIRDLRHIHNTNDQTACIIATSIIHSKLTIVTLYCAISLPLKLIIFDLPSTLLLLVLSPKLQNFITLLLF